MRFLRFAVVAIIGLSAPVAAGRQNPKPPPSGITLHPFGGLGTRQGGRSVPAPVPVILHRMFVTGDPDQKPGQALSHGRASVRPKTN